MNARQFMHTFPDGNQVVATERDPGRLFTLEWQAPLHASHMREYMNWSRQVLFELSRARISRDQIANWTMLWPNESQTPTEWCMWSAC